MLKKIWIAAGLVGIAGVAAVLMFVAQQKPYTWHGSLFRPANPSAPIQLSDTKNGQFHLEQERGKVVLLFFGYTHCPDECPLTMAKLKEVESSLGPQADQTVVVFVTIDPGRDTPDVLRAYLASFNPAFIGLTGSQPDLERVWKAYGVDPQINGDQGLEGYTVAHSTALYLIDPQGRLRLTYGLDNSPTDIVSDVRYLLSNG